MFRLRSVVFVAVLVVVAMFIIPMPGHAQDREVRVPLALQFANYSEWGFKTPAMGFATGLEVEGQRAMFCLSGDYSPTTKQGVDRMYSVTSSATEYARFFGGLFVGAGLRWSYINATASQGWTKSSLHPTVNFALGRSPEQRFYVWYAFPGSDNVNRERTLTVGAQFATARLRAGGRYYMLVNYFNSRFDEPWQKNIPASGAAVNVGYIF